MALKLKSVRAAAERLLLADLCTVYRGQDRLGKGIWNNATLEYEQPAAIVEYSGPCNIGKINNFPSDTLIGGAPEVTTNYYLKIPANALIDVRKEDVVVVDGVHVGGDLTLLGQEFLVEAAPEVATYTVLRAIRIKRYEKTPQ